jgi:quinol monooxygenase YgiN
MMLVRIVHMYFTQDGVEKFLEIFGGNADAIRRMQGCLHVELLADVEDPCHFMTLSHWDSADYLDQYRNSALFKSVWTRVKPLFARKPMACSMQDARLNRT